MSFPGIRNQVTLFDLADIWKIQEVELHETTKRIDEISATVSALPNPENQYGFSMADEKH
jgi:hypothetical protein